MIGFVTERLDWYKIVNPNILVRTLTIQIQRMEFEPRGRGILTVMEFLKVLI